MHVPEASKAFPPLYPCQPIRIDPRAIWCALGCCCSVESRQGLAIPCTATQQGILDSIRTFCANAGPNHIPLKSIISFITRHWKSIGTVLGILFAGVGIYIFQNIPQISEFFRGPKIVVEPQINTDGDIVFREPNAVEIYEGDYAQLMREAMWCSIVETTPIFAYYIEKGYLSSEDLNKMRAKRDQILKQFKETFADVPISVHIKNNGWRATTIESVEIFIPSIGKTGPMYAKFENVKRYIEPSKVDDLYYIGQIEVGLLMHGAIIDLLTKLSAQMPDNLKGPLLDTAGTQLEVAPFISFDSKGTVIVTDQFETQYTGTFDLRPISVLLEKARPRESKEAESKQNTPG